MCSIMVTYSGLNTTVNSNLFGEITSAGAMRTGHDPGPIPILRILGMHTTSDRPIALSTVLGLAANGYAGCIRLLPRRRTSARGGDQTFGIRPPPKSSW